MKSTITISGQTDEKGKPFIINNDEKNEFFKAFPNHRFVMICTVYAAGSTASQIGYYKNKIVPDFKEAFKISGELLTLQQTDERLREMSPVCQSEIVVNGGFSAIVRPIEDLSVHEMIEFLDYIRMIGATEFSLNIEDPKRL